VEGTGKILVGEGAASLPNVNPTVSTGKGVTGTRRQYKRRKEKEIGERGKKRRKDGGIAANDAVAFLLAAPKS